MPIGDDIIIVKPNRKDKAKPSDLLSDEQVKYIQKVLEKSCQNNVCIPKETLYEAIREKLKLNIALYQFEQALTDIFRQGKIPGFKPRAGRNGGIGRISEMTKKK